jgi:broad specificity phosphatase PhoE
MLRSRQTAEAIAQATPILTFPELDEISYGEWDGKTWQEIEERDPDLARRKLADWKGITPPGGETWAHFEARVLDVFERIRLGPFPAAVVGHSAVNAVIASRLCGLEALGWNQGYGEIHAIDF